MLFATTPFLASQAKPSASPAPLIRTTTRDVVVDVVVTRGNGDAVTGLHSQDFHVFEDGKPQTIDFFEEHAAKTQLAGSLPTLPKMPPNVYTNVPPAPEDDAVNVLLLDSLNTSPQMISYARNEILSYLDHVKPGTRMAIMAMNDKLSIVQGFTADVARLREIVLGRTAPGTSPSLVTKSEIGAEQELEDFFLNSLGGSIGNSNAPSGAGWTSPTAPMAASGAVASAFANYRSFQLANRIRMTLEALSDIARYLAAVPGRKNLIWFSGDFPVVIFPKFDQRQDYEDMVVPLSQVQKTADLLTAARVAVYPVYANGLMTDDIVSADNRGPASASAIGHLSSVAGIGLYTASNDVHAGEIAAMNQIASDTGGKAIYNTNDLDTAIGRSVADGSHYYTLVYSPTNKKIDRHYRKIEIKLADSKLKLSYRRGYNADEDLAQAANTKKETDPLRQELAHGMPDATQILFAARVVPNTPQPPSNAKHAGKNPALTGPFTRYSIDLFIRWSDLKFATASDGSHQGKIQVGLLAWDGTGKSVNWEEATQVMALKPDIFASIQKSGVPSHMEVDLPNKGVYLRIGVFDWGSGKAGTLEIPLHPGAVNGNHASLQPPAKP